MTKPLHPRRRDLMAMAGLMALAGWSAAAISSPAQAVNQAGRLRMQALRISKAYLALSIGIDTAVGDKILKEGVSSYDAAITQLRVYSPTPEIKDAFAGLTTKWQGYKDLVIGTAPSKDNAAKVIELSEDLVQRANTATGLLEQQSGAPSSKLVNMAGRQRMLSQRVALYTLASNWAVPAKDAQAQVAKAQSEYKQALQTLQAAKENSADIKQQLAQAERMWVFFESAIGGLASNKPKTKENFVVASELIIQSYDEVTALYAKLA